MSKFKQTGRRGFLAALIVVSLSGCTQVNAGNLGVVTKWGEIQPDPLPEGIYFRMPIQTQIINMSARVHKIGAGSTASSKDSRNISTSGLSRMFPR